MISESILRLFDGLVKMQAEELTKELQALMDENLTEEEKELLLQRILEGKLRLRETRKQYRRTKKQVNDIYKKYWFERIRFAEYFNVLVEQDLFNKDVVESIEPASKWYYWNEDEENEDEQL